MMLVICFQNDYHWE